MEKQMVAKTSHRFLAFMIDMLLVGLTMQLMMMILKGPYETWFHFEALQNEYYELGILHGVFDASHNTIPNLPQTTVDAFLNLDRVKDITSTFNKNQMIANCINGLVASSIFQFIIPAIIGEGRSIGKILTKLRVVKKDGSKIGFLNIFLRGFVGMTLIELVVSMPLGFLPFTVSAVLVFSSNSKRALHDYIAGTKVTYVEGCEPEVKVREKPIYEHNHTSVKGFEYIDIEALEKRERESQERMNRSKNPEEVNEVIETKEEEKEPVEREVIDLEAIEKREKAAQERMNKKKEEQAQSDVIDVESKDIDNENK